MIRFTHAICLTFLLFAHDDLPRGGGQALPPAQIPVPAQKPNMPQPVPVPVPVPGKVYHYQQVIQQPQSYAQALDIIKKMPAPLVLPNNSFNPQFLNLVKAFNFSNIETKALLEAGAHIHATWSDDNQTNKHIISSLKNSIQATVASKPAAQNTPNAVQSVVPQPQATPQKQIARHKRTPQPAKPPVIQPVQQPQQIVKQPVKQNVPKQQPPSTNNYSSTNTLVMALDPRKEETAERGGGALVQQSLIALYSKACPVIMTTNIFEIILAIKKQVGEQNLQQLRSAGFQQLFPRAQQLQQLIRIPGINYLVLILLSNINFDAQNIMCYFHTSENLVLLIPKEYIRANIPKVLTLSPNEQARACGFNPQVLRTITDLSTDNLLKQVAVENTRPEQLDQFTTRLTEMLAIQKQNGELITPEQDSKWIIYIVGHGSPTHMTIGTAREHYNMIKESVDNIHQTFTMGARLQRAERQRLQKYLNEYEPKLQEYEKMLEGRSGWNNNQMIPESAQIAGIMAPRFAQLMKYFDEDLDTAYVHYVTCFSGGSNQTFVNETLSALDVHFIVSTQGIHEGHTSAEMSVGMASDKPGIQVKGQDFAEFFYLLKLFFTQQKEFVKIKGKMKDPIVSIIKTINADEKGQSQPFVRFPGAAFFEAIPTTKKTKTLTKTIVKAHEIEKKPIDLTDPTINIVIINTPRINVPLQLGKRGAEGHIALVTPSPSTFSAGYEGLYLFKELDWQDTLQSLLFNYTYLNTRMYPQTFAIKTLSGVFLQQSGINGKESEPITNFIMSLRSVPGNNPAAPELPAMQLTPVTPQTVQAGKVGTNIHIACEVSQTIYQCFFAIRNIEKTDDLRAAIEKLKFIATPKKSIDMNTFAQNFLTQQEIAQVQKPITLETVIDYIDDKIDKQDPSMAIWSEADVDALAKMVQKEAVKTPQPQRKKGRK
jgi:hypothetical protein